MTDTGKPKPPKPAPLNLRIPPDLKRRFKVRCAQNGVEMTDVITGFIREYLARPK